MATRTKRPTIHEPIITATTGETAPYFEGIWSTEYLDPLLHRADPLADRIVELLYKEGRRNAELSGEVTDRPRSAFQFLSLLIDQMSIPDPDVEFPFAAQGSKYTLSVEVRTALREFLRQAQILPSWTDFDLIRKAQDLFKDNPLLAYPMLAFLSLPVLYTCGRGGTSVLVLTGQIDMKVRRRVVETGTMVMSVMQSGSFTERSERSTLTNPIPFGIEAILRVRLLHAASRTIINEFWKDGLNDRAAEAGKPADEPSTVRMYMGTPADQIWKKEWGVPISQQYLAGVLMSFSYIDIYGLEKVGVIVTSEEKKAYMHLWNVFGRVLGIEEEPLLRLDFPRTGRVEMAGGRVSHEATGEEMVATGRALFKRVLELNRTDPDDAAAIQNGRTLTMAIVQYMGRLMRRRIPFAGLLRLDKLPHMMMSFLLSNDDRELLGIKINPIDRLLFPMIMWILRLRGIVAKSVGAPASMILARLFFTYMQDENNSVYEELAEQQKEVPRYPGIPTAALKKWGMKT